jgi:hypothetical protein
VFYSTHRPDRCEYLIESSSSFSDLVLIAVEDSTLMQLGGEPRTNGERFIWWNFVSSRRERVEQSKADWEDGRIILPPNDDKEFVPLPKDQIQTRGQSTTECVVVGDEDVFIVIVILCRENCTAFGD